MLLSFVELIGCVYVIGCGVTLLETDHLLSAVAWPVVVVLALVRK